MLGGREFLKIMMDRKLLKTALFWDTKLLIKLDLVAYNSGWAVSTIIGFLCKLFSTILTGQRQSPCLYNYSKHEQLDASGVHWGFIY